MGHVRKLWREHLALANDNELRCVLTGLRIVEGHRSLDEVREQINLRAQVVGLIAYSDESSDFRYDELARQLKVRGLNSLTRATLKQFCRDEGLFAPRHLSEDSFLDIAVRSFLGAAADICGAAPENTLLLTDDFRQRYLRDDLDWQIDIRPRIEAFLRESVARSSGRLRLILDAHASIAFLAGATLDLKSGVTIELVQKGRVGARTWRPDDGSAGAALDVSVHDLGRGASGRIAQFLEFIASKVPAAWLELARLYSEQETDEGLDDARRCLRRYLEDPDSQELLIVAWGDLADLCRRLDDPVGEVHALVELCQVPDIAIDEISSVANRINNVYQDLKHCGVSLLDTQERQVLVRKGSRRHGAPLT